LDIGWKNLGGLIINDIQVFSSFRLYLFHHFECWISGNPFVLW
jgi:hypothetical protein